MSEKVDQFLIRKGFEPKSFGHYGTLGMKWGRRKSRRNTPGSNSDSSGDQSTKSKPEESAKAKRPVGSGSSRAPIKNTFTVRPANKRMSDAELRSRISRLDMEKRFKELTAPTPKAKGFVKQLLAEQGKSAMRQIATRAVSAALQIALEKAAGNATGGNKAFLEAMAKTGQGKKKK